MKRNTTIGLALVLIAVLWLAFAPPRWWLNLTKPVDLSDPIAAGALVVEEYDCRDCHRIDGHGGLIAGNLAGVTRRLDEDSIRTWLRNPFSTTSTTNCGGMTMFSGTAIKVTMSSPAANPMRRADWL